ncbi:MAG: hypothetical protein ACK47U_00505 [Verrucomicrobiota bacterium]|jgi:hypothetical protein
MKHILPILTLTTLAAAASAQSAGAAGLSYNRVGVNYNTDSAENGYSVSAEALIGSSNVWVGGSADLDNAGADSVSVGYLFKNVAAGIDATVAVSSNDTYGVILRRSLNEVVAGLEARFVYSQSTGGNSVDTLVYELAYNIGAKYQVAVSIADQDGSDNETSVSVRYNF